MGKISNLLIGAGIGAGWMYFYDPQNGKQRRADFIHRVENLQSQSDAAIEHAARDVQDTLRGAVTQGLSRVSTQTNQLADQANEALSSPPAGEDAAPLAPAEWSPTIRLLAGLSGAYLVLYGGVRGGLIGMLARMSGVALTGRAVTNRNVRKLTHQLTGGKDMLDASVAINKTLRIKAPVAEVYALWSNFENFAHFMHNIDSISVDGDISHWVVKGPAGSHVKFDARTIQKTTNQRITWETLPGASVQHEGKVRFRKVGENASEINVSMRYTPPAGVAGAVVAALFGKDPQAEMDEDLARMKELLEKGRTETDGETVTKQAVMPATSANASQKGSLRASGPQSHYDVGPDQPIVS